MTPPHKPEQVCQIGKPVLALIACLRAQIWIAQIGANRSNPRIERCVLLYNT